MVNKHQRKEMYDKGFVVFDFLGKEWTVRAADMNKVLWFMGLHNVFYQITAWSQGDTPPEVIRFSRVNDAGLDKMSIEDAVRRHKATSVWPSEVHETMAENESLKFIVHSMLLMGEVSRQLDNVIRAIGDLAGTSV